MMDWQKAEVELKKKLDPSHVKPPSKFGPKGDYIEGWHAMAEANRIFGFGEWSYTVKSCSCVSERDRKIGSVQKDGFGVTYTAMVSVEVGGVIREDVGAGHGYDVDCGLAHESAIKEAVTDALKRCLRSFGNPFGLALYDKTRENVGVDIPPFDARAAADRIIISLGKRSTVADITELWNAEKQTMGEIKAANKAIFDEVSTQFKHAGEEAKAKEAA